MIYKKTINHFRDRFVGDLNLILNRQWAVRVNYHRLAPWFLVNIIDWAQTSRTAPPTRACNNSFYCHSDDRRSPRVKRCRRPHWNRRFLRRNETTSGKINIVIILYIYIYIVFFPIGIRNLFQHLCNFRVIFILKHSKHTRRKQRVIDCVSNVKKSLVIATLWAGGELIFFFLIKLKNHSLSSWSVFGYRSITVFSEGETTTISNDRTFRMQDACANQSVEFGSFYVQQENEP